MIKFLIVGENSIDKIPLIAGCIGWIGGFFKTSIKYNKNKD